MTSSTLPSNRNRVNIPPSTYIIDPIFPTREIHIVAGASGAGKSTLLSQIANQFLNGEDIFGYTPNPISGIAYIAFDRTLKSMARTFERSLQSGSSPFPFYSTVDSPEFAEHRDPVAAIKQLKHLHPLIDVLIVDGIGIAFKGDSAKLADVAGFVHNLLRAMSTLESDLTIFAIHHMSKTKKGNEYAQARAKLHGSIAWAATAETIILIEPEEDDNPENPNRIITLCPRNAPERQYTYCFDEFGRLIPGAKLQDPSQGKRTEFYAAIAAIPLGEVKTSDLRTIALSFNISEATFKRWIKDLCEIGQILTKGKHGIYVRVNATIH